MTTRSAERGAATIPRGGIVPGGGLTPAGESRVSAPGGEGVPGLAEPGRVDRLPLSIREAARRLGVSPEATRKAIARGVLRAQRLELIAGSAVVLVDPASLGDYRPDRLRQRRARRRASTASRHRDGASSENTGAWAVPAAPRTLATASPLSAPAFPDHLASESARALLAARRCPGCEASLTGRQRGACSARCRARLSRVRATAAAAQRIAQLERAVRALGGDPETLPWAAGPHRLPVRHAIAELR